MPARHGENWQPGPGSLVDFQHPWAQGCYVAWYAQAATGNYWPDLARQGNTGTLVGGAAATTGPSIYFDGSDDYMTYPNLLVDGRTTFSFMARMSFVADTAKVIFQERQDSTHNLYWQYAGSAAPRWYLTVNGTNYTPAVGGFLLTTGQFYTVGFSFNAGTIRFFIDGGLREQKTGAATPSTTPGAQKQLWRNVTTIQSAGNLSWFAIWDRALPDAYFAEFINRPYEMIWTPGRRRMFWMGAAAAGVSLTSDHALVGGGTAAATGVAPLAADHALVGGGAAAATGVAPLAAEHALVGGGTAAATGVAPLAADHALVGGGAAAATGVAPLAADHLLVGAGTAAGVGVAPLAADHILLGGGSAAGTVADAVGTALAADHVLLGGGAAAGTIVPYATDYVVGVRAAADVVRTLRADDALKIISAADAIRVIDLSTRLD